MRSDGLGNERHHMIAAPAKILLQFGRVCGPGAVESPSAFVAAISRGRGVAAREAKVAGISEDRSAEGAAGVKEEVLIPIGWQWQLQLEFVLRRDVAGHLAILANPPSTFVDGASKSAGTQDPSLETGRGHIDQGSGGNDRRTSGRAFEVQSGEGGALLCLRSGGRALRCGQTRQSKPQCYDKNDSAHSRCEMVWLRRHANPHPEAVPFLRAAAHGSLISRE